MKYLITIVYTKYIYLNKTKSQRFYSPLQNS